MEYIYYPGPAILGYHFISNFGPAEALEVSNAVRSQKCNAAHSPKALDSATLDQRNTPIKKSNNSIKSNRIHQKGQF